MRIIETEIFLIESGQYDGYYFAEYVPDDETVYISLTKSSVSYSDYVNELNRIESTIGIGSISMDVFKKRLKERKDIICLKLKKCIQIA